MAKTLITTCDAHTGTKTPGSKVVVRVGNTVLSADLCSEHQKQLVQTIKQALGGAGKTTAAKTRRSPARKTRRADANIPPSSEVRAWARANNVPVNPRGNVFTDVVEKYLAAQAAGSTNNGENSPQEASATLTKRAAAKKSPAKRAAAKKAPAKRAAAKKAPAKRAAAKKSPAKKAAAKKAA